MSWIRRLATSASALELFIDMVGIIILLIPFDANARRLAFTTVLVITLATSVVGMIYGYWLNPGGPFTARRIRGIIFGSTLGCLITLTGLILLWWPVFGMAPLLVILWLIIVTSTIADAIAAYNILR